MEEGKNHVGSTGEGKGKRYREKEKGNLLKRKSKH